MMRKSVVQSSTAGIGRPLRVLLAAGCLGLLLTACRSGSDDPPPIDASLSRDLSLAGSDTRSAQTTFGDTAARTDAPSDAPARVRETPPPSVATTARPTTPRPTPPARRPETRPSAVAEPRPATPTPTPAPESPNAPVAGAGAGAGAAPPPARRTLVGAGTELVGQTGTRVCNTTNAPGDRVVMRLATDVTAADGTRLNAGTPVLLELAAANDSVLTFRVKSISLDGELYPLLATATVESELEGSRVAGGSDKKKVIGGAIAGAILGQILGKDTKSTVIGAAGGAAAGTVIASRSGSTEQCLAAGSTVRVVVLQPVMSNGTGA